MRHGRFSRACNGSIDDFYNFVSFSFLFERVEGKSAVDGPFRFILFKFSDEQIPRAVLRAESDYFISIG